jgi:hypothetical protein
LNLFQLAGLLTAIASVIWCARWGFSRHGWAGIFLGVPGAMVGGIAGIAAVALLFFTGCWLERCRHHRGLQASFGRYWSRRRAVAWRELKAKLGVGDAVSGRVVACYYHGSFIDTGHGFPARLGVIWSRSGVEGPRPSIGDTVAARVRGFELGDRVIELTQLEDGTEMGLEERRAHR